ncbi:MAG: hypothetical protein QF819_04430 [Gemmatimonadota bacterium]|nr:hypothetical protein [Gemmatimonadota bacterium]MDP6461320.1 hypothetical protein [Gemmatimonadota bacterium]MDP6528850.1 hypothetical protein [Gemmatimonadota bacterium]MDP6802404.1 hypothetical protein [Gemmatimonadota bacterium]MDP7031081.1 hypothetical protein [Gemmatimonadota bacterium]
MNSRRPEPFPTADRPRIPAFTPAPSEVEDLVESAKTHPLGMDYLLEGAPDSVAATFGVHAFVVDAARAALRDGEPAGKIEARQAQGG